MPSTAWPYKRKAEIPLDGDAKKVLAYAAREADREKQYWIDRDHLLKGLLIFPNEAADTLIKTGVQLESLRTASVQHRKEVPPLPAPKGAKWKATPYEGYRTEVLASRTDRRSPAAGLRLP